MKKLLLLQNKGINKDVEKKLKEIVRFLVNIDNKDDIPPSLLSGITGISFFLFYYAKYSKDEYYEDKAMEFLSYSINNIDKCFNSSFCGGIGGICWCLQHLIDNKFIDAENKNIIKTFDTYLCSHILQNSSINYYDYLHGSIGTASYLLKRIENGKVKECEEKIIDILNNSKICIDNSCYWESRIGEKINISLSHGIASICIFLSKAYKLNIKKPLTKELLEKSISFILAQEINASHRLSMFPSFSLSKNSNGNSFQASRLGWCYGDLGIALAIWHYAQIANDEEMRQKTIEIFLHSASRRDLEKNAVIDGGICHGTAGIALIFRKMYYNTYREEFFDAANFWLYQTLKMSKYNDGIVGYKANQKTPSIDFLNGITGIGFVLLSFLTNEDTVWDECLLLS
jgi:lantibiotic modifying enzyme